MLVAMHMPDHILSPTVTLATAIAAAGTALLGAWHMRRSTDNRAAQHAGLVAAVAALVFAGQMVNYTLPFNGTGEGVSGHLLGGAIAALLLGPWAAMGVMIVVLVVQCLVFGDGGLSALGANVLNMAIVGVWAAWGVRRAIAKNGTVGIPTAALAGFISVVAAAGVCSQELLASGGAEAGAIIRPMLTYHLAIGAVEGLMTAGVIAIVASYQTKSFANGADSATQAPTIQARTKGALLGLIAALAIAAFLAPLASASPDGLEVALVGGNFSTGSSFWNAPLTDYELPASLGATSAVAAVAIAILGTLVAFAGGWCVTRAGHAIVRR
ncbi:MAG: energy-coupling factor ABC transporter permease [Planctomycetia bacterium]|nr:energy-coupling factor ABC transporter permease [Planctomycetia bacterium]